MEKMLMQEYIEDYAKFLCMEESEGTLFYFLLNRDRLIAVGRGPGPERISPAREDLPLRRTKCPGHKPERKK